MKSHIWKTTIMSCLLLLPTAALAGAIVEITVQANSQFYFMGDEAISIARSQAKEKIYGICEKKGMTFYEGDLVKNSKPHAFAWIKYDHLQCKKRKDEGQKCSITATGICIPKDSDYFSASCGKKSWVTGRSILLHGALIIIGENGTKYTINPASIQNGEVYRTLCGMNPDENPKVSARLIQKTLRLFRHYMTNCKALTKENKGVAPPKCAGSLPEDVSSSVRG